MAKSIGFINFHKNSGKTVSTAFFAESLANFNLKVLAIDLDINLNLSRYLGLNIDSQNFEIQKIRKFQNEWDFVAISNENKDIWLAQLQEIKNKFDYILYDFPSFESELSGLVLEHLDSVILPIECEFYGLEKVNLAIEKIVSRPNLELEGILLTKVDSNNNRIGEIVSKVKKAFSALVFDTKISRNYYLGLPYFNIESMNNSITHFGFADYLKLANEFLDKKIENGQK